MWGQGKNLERLLKEQGITGKELAERIGVTSVTVSRWKNQHAAISRLHAEDIHREYPMYAVAYILGCTEDPGGDMSGLVKVAQSVREIAKIAEKYFSRRESMRKLLAQIGIESTEIAAERARIGERLSDGEQSVELPTAQYDELIEEIIGYAKFRVDLIFKRELAAQKAAQHRVVNIPE